MRFGLSLSALNRKLFRDLLAMKSQALAIATVVAAGIAMYVMYLSNFESLRATQRAYYERQRFADVFASLKRAPLRVATDIAAIPGVSAIETRVVANVTLDLDQIEEPATAGSCRFPRTGGRGSTISSCGAAGGSSRAARTRCSPARGSSSRTDSIRAIGFPR